MKWLTPSERLAMASGKRTISYQTLMQQIANKGSQLQSICKPGDRIALLGSNCPEWALGLYCAWFNHAIAVPVDALSTAEDIAYVLKDCTPTVVICSEKLREKLNQAIQSLPDYTPHVLAMDTLFAPEDSTSEPQISLYESDDAETALIVYTSGTTGTPKGVMLTFGNIAANIAACTTQTQVYKDDDRILVVLPLHHAYPLMGTLVLPISIGATSIFATSLSSAAIIAALREYHCTFIVGVPRMLEIFRNGILDKVKSSLLGRLLFRLCYLLGSLRLSRFIFKKVQDGFGGAVRFIASGGAESDPQVTRDFYALGFELLEGYGMTETAPMISFTPPGRHKPGSPGKPIPCNEVKISDGEILIKGANVMKGYYKRPEETAMVLDADGWLHTGDLGYLDKDGFLFLTGRSKELIILGNGKNINPVELEQKLINLSNGLFTECAVSENGKQMELIAVPDLEVVKQRGISDIQQTIQDEILTPFNASVPSYKRIALITLRQNPLPRTRLGKIQRHLLHKSK